MQFPNHNHKDFLHKKALTQAIERSLVALTLVGSLLAQAQQPEVFPPVIELSALNQPDGINGLVITGNNEFSLAGRIRTAGDINDDGVVDILIGVPRDDVGNEINAGRCYLIFGGNHLTGTFSQSDLNQPGEINGITFNGIQETDSTCHAASTAGDINGDGIDDLLIGAYGAGFQYSSGGPGAAYIIYGGSKLPGDVDLSNLNGPDGASGVTIINSSGSLSDRFGWSVSRAGDINNDGMVDIIIGARAAENSEGDISGQAFIVFGSDSLPNAFELSTLNELESPTGIIINGINNGDLVGNSVSNAGDVNDDGIDDLIIGANRANANSEIDSGQSYIIYGDIDLPGVIELSALNQPGGDVSGVLINGFADDYQSGMVVSNAGDFNGDGIDDVLISAPRAGILDVDEGIFRLRAGESYLIFGSTDIPDVIELSAMGQPDDDNGVVIRGVTAFDYSGRSLSNAGDVNRDGTDDIIIGAYGADASNDKPNTGQSYVIFGNCCLPKMLYLSSLNLPDSPRGVFINGIDARDNSGLLVGNAGDVNEDNIDDFFIGATSADQENMSDAGESYVVFGISEDLLLRDGFE